MKVKIGNYPKHRFYHNWLYALGWTNDEKVSVRIDPWDTWAMDSTLAHIVVPMLEQFKNTTHGAPSVSEEDLPEHLISTLVDIPDKDVDELHFKAWDWILTEMLFSFKSKHNGWEDQFYLGKDNLEGLTAYQKRITNGFRLFGKYYENLWN